MSFLRQTATFFKKTANYFELPKEVVFNMPRTVILGDESMIVENHKGIIEFDKKNVRLKIDNGILLIKGDGFYIENLSKEDILIKGTIHNINFER